METKFSGHSVYRTQYHLVWIAKYRRRIFKNPGLKNAMVKLLYKIAKSMPGVEIIEQNVQPDHVHMMVEIPPRYAIAEVVQGFKGASSYHLRKHVKWIRKVFGKKNKMWSNGYFVSTLGIDEDVVQKYIKYQQDLDSGQAKLDL